MTTEEHYVALGAGMTLLARMGELGESVAVELYNNNVVATLVDAMSVLDHSPEGLGTAVCDCSRALVVIPDCSVELYNQGVFSALLTSILSYCETSPQFATAVFNLLLAACEDFDELQQAVVAEEGLQTACSALVYHQDNVRYQVSGLELIHMMVVHVATLKEFMAMGGKTVAQRLVGNSSSAAIPMRALDILVEMSSR
ncbi:MAG: hypothetical protein KVP17_000285 [Porospora cf. gigantea B]|nr:MAG: hypothetical protein KVP17_000285 [Porospora cf. gigantea B]